jgi:two-component system CheB/CheR fusion protein
MSKEETNKPKIPSQNLFPVVGIGASAGGLEAFKKLITAIPEDSGMAYILVQHLHPGHESALPEILQRVSKIPVVEISDNVHVDPDNIYVIPSNKILVATDGVLKLSPRSAKDRLNLPINIFFSSLAEVHQAHAIGVVLSGTGSDGTAGLKDIKDQGGLTFAQDPASAAYDGMPQHAIDAGIVDFIISPEKISEKLLELRQSFINASSDGSDAAKDKINEDAFRQILALLRVRVGVDFNFYKQTTVRRRIIRRMVMLQLETITDYLDYLKKNKPELDILFQDLLIPVTSFFRDPVTFDTLCETVFPEIIKNKPAGTPLRFWIAGCSTGQEAYSIAICLHEYLNENISTAKVQIFATDLSEKAIKKARAGIYAKKELEGISDNRLQQFFIKTDGHYQVKKTVRDMCIFAVHNFLKDPPFAKMDFISCRNVLIYLEPFLQKKALTLFHYALNDKGILLLGKSETTGNAADIFIPFGKKDKYFTRKAVPGRFTNVASERSEAAFADKNYFMRSKEGKTDDFQKNADDILLQKYTPVGVVVNDQFDIVQFRGSTGEYLEPSPGKASLNILKMAKEGLAFEIRNALHKAKTTSEPFIKEGIPINAGKKLVTIEVVPLLNTVDLHFLILFREQLAISNEQLTAGNEKKNLQKIKKDEKDIRIQQLEKELARLREDMHSITEDQEAANEELQSSNEELLSGSEELQSLNEELETSKEEIQSTNEELITVNQELYDRNEELNQSQRFAEATLAVLHEPLLVLDKNFIIKSANKSFYKTFQLTESNTLGKNLFALQDNGWAIPGLRNDLERIQKEKEKMLELESTFAFPVIGRRTICFNIQAINRENGEQLILLALDDMTLRKNVEKIIVDKAAEVLKEHQLLHRYLMESPAPFVILKGSEHIFEFVNSSYHQLTGNRDLLGKKMMEAIPELKGQGFVEIVDEVYRTGKPYTGAEMPAFIEKVKGKPAQVYVNLHCQALENEQGIIEGILVFSFDVTELVLGRKHLERNAEMIQNLYLNAPAYVATFRGPTHIYDLVNPSYQKLFGSRKIQGKPVMEALPELEGQGLDKLLDNVYNTGEIFVGKEILIWLAYDEGLAPAERYFNFSYQPIYNYNKIITGVLVFGYEATEQILAKKMQLEYAERFRTLADTMPQKMNTTDADGNIDYLNQQWYDYTNMHFEELKDWGWEKMMHPDDLEITVKNWQHSIKTGEVYQLEHRFRRYDGTYRWHLSRGLPEKDKDGKIISWIATHTDIDDQKNAEEKIRAAEEFSRSVLQSSPDCVKVLDKEGLLYFMNTNGLCQMEIDDFNFVKNQPWWQLWGEGNKQFVETALATALAGNKAQFQAYCLTAKKTPKWWDVIVSPLFSPDGEVTQLISVSRDITERIKLEQKKDEFISIASHEMKTPLTTAKAYLQLLELSLGTENATANLYVKKASLSVGRLNELVGELLDVSKIQHGKLDYNISSFNFNEMVDITVEDVQHTSPKHAIAKTGKVHQQVVGDKDRLQQVIINLLSNAIKYSPDSLDIYINIAEQDNEIKVSVKDNGIGISQQHLDKIFDRYYRVEEHAIQFQGLGIGLFISYEIILRHKGKLWVESEPGKGSTFYFTLPLV